MHLKSLVLKGFKSFADRTAIALEPGITAVVGPNGSGKSNISDAVLWVLGERNAKNLRGQAMEDVIFAGSSARKGVGMAEVDLVLDNTDATLPVEFSEVSLTRRMYKTGESEYLINGSPARRMDFMDILHDTGLGTGTHSIIGQGNLDAILASRPEDRRTLVEEAAGVLKHKQRKERSARKLAAMDAHLERVKDVAAEVERQLKPLARKAARAEAYQAAAEELAHLELVLAVDELRLLQAKWDDICLKEKESAAAIDIARLSSQEAAEKLEKLQVLLQEKGLYAGDLAAQRGRFHMALERFESADRLLTEKERGLRSRLDAARDAAAGGERRIARLEDETATLRSSLGDIAARRDALLLQIDELSASFDTAAKKRAAIDADLSEVRSRLRACERELDSSMAKRSELQDSLAGRKTAKDLIEAKREEAQLERAEVERELELRCRELDDEAAELERLAQESRNAADRVKELSRAACDARGKADEERRLLQRMEARIAVLEEAGRSLRAKNDATALAARHASDADKAAFSLASCIKAPQELEHLVESLLGDDLAALCVSDSSYAAQVMSALRESGEEGTASVLFSHASEHRRVEAPRLLDDLEYPEAVASLMETLLGDVVMAASADEAWRRAECDDIRARYATCDGMVVYPGAKAVFYGKTTGEGVLARERELSSLRLEFEKVSASLAVAEGDRVRLDEALEAEQASSLELSRRHAQRKGENDSARAERDRLAKRAGALEAAEAAAAADLEAAVRELSLIQPEIEALEKLADDCRAKRIELEEQAAVLDADRIAAYEEEQGLRAELSQAKLDCATAKERASSLDREHREKTRELERAVRSKERAASDIARLEAAASRIGPLHTVFASLRESARSWVDDLSGKAALAQSTSEELSASIVEARNAERDAQQRLDAAQAALADVRIEKGKLEVQVQAALSSIVNEKGVSIESALELPPPEDRQTAIERVERLQRRLKSMGTIDSSAAEEYAAMKERYDFLASQIEDVEAARRALRRIVSAIDARMKEQFDLTFAQVDENFRRIFAQLFPGGSGSLELTNADDPDHMGVEVHAQPRGKRIAKMTLMSGGEKSLVAIALLFAVYGIRHTPFYILDEVEAALDDSNLRRLLAYLETLRHETQLIMITHQRRTMEMADVLYGISMQADGVTKAVSQRLDHALAHAEG